MFHSLRRSLLLSLLVVAVGAAGLAFQAGAVFAAPTTCGGEVFHDFDHDGEIVEDYSHVSNQYASVADDPVPGCLLYTSPSPRDRG